MVPASRQGHGANIGQPSGAGSCLAGRRPQRVPLKQAAIEAGAVRTTPILLTAGTVVIGAFVILFDPIFQGLAISLMGGTIVSTILTLLVVPLVYYMIERKNFK